MRHEIICGLLALILFAWAMPAGAQMQSLNDDQMGTVTGQVGITISLDHATFYDEYARISIFDSDNAGSLVLNDVVVGDGAGWGYWFSTKDDPITIDILRRNVGSILIPDWDSYLSITAPSWEQEMSISVDSVEFCGTALGSLEVEQINLNNFEFILTPPSNNGTAIYFKYFSQSSIDRVEFAYNNQATGSLAVSGIWFAESFSGASTNPSEWVSSGNFELGDSGGTGDSNFYQIQLVNNSGALAIETTPTFNGSIRMEGVSFGGTNFGPVVLDGITVNSMTVDFNL